MDAKIKSELETIAHKLDGAIDVNYKTFVENGVCFSCLENETPHRIMISYTMDFKAIETAASETVDLLVRNGYKVKKGKPIQKGTMWNCTILYSK